MMKTRFYYLICCLALCQKSAWPESIPISLPTDAHLVTFTFNDDDIYTILTGPGLTTDIQLHPDEQLNTLVIGDSVQWKTAKTNGHVFIKPIKPNLHTNATLVTDQRVYQLTLHSSPTGGKWYQRTSWEYPQLLEQREQRRQNTIEQQEQQQKLAEPLQTDIALEKLNFSYHITGNAPFRPNHVMDDGLFTWIHMPSGLQELPAVFVIGSNGEAELVNFIVKKNYLLVQRIAPKIQLKLGTEEIRIERNKKPSSWNHSDVQ